MSEFLKLRRLFLIDFIHVEPFLNDISKEFAIVETSFIGNVCHEQCPCYQCKEQKFRDLDEPHLVVSKECPFYAEAVINDIRSFNEN